MKKKDVLKNQRESNEELREGKGICQTCGKVFNQRKLRIYNNKLLCIRCEKKEITNPFYISPEKRKSKYTLDEYECKRLYAHLMKMGLTKKEASRRINMVKYRLKRTKNMWKRKNIIQREAIKEKKKLNKKFLEGLGQK